MGRRQRQATRRLAEAQPSARYGAQTFDSLYLLVCTQDRLLAIRNEVIQELRPHLTDRHRLLLGWPPGSAAAQAYEEARGLIFRRVAEGADPWQ